MFPHPNRYCPRVTHIIAQGDIPGREPYTPSELWKWGIGDLEELIWHTARNFGTFIGVGRVCDFKFAKGEDGSLSFLHRFEKNDPCEFNILGDLAACGAMPEKPKSVEHRIMYDTQGWFTRCRVKECSHITFWGFTTKEQYILVDVAVGKVKRTRAGVKKGYVMISAATSVTLHAFPDREAFFSAMQPGIGYEELWAGLMAFFPHHARMYRKLARDVQRSYRSRLAERSAIRKAIKPKG